MKYAEFVNELARYPEHELVFECGDTRVRRGFHLTEVLRMTVDAIDCGGVTAHWTETMLQLVESGAEAAPRVMRASKALAILQASQAQIPQPADSELILEFRGANAIAAQRFYVTQLGQWSDGVLTVRSTGLATQCKAAQRSGTVCAAPSQPGSACCPASAAQQVALAAAACCGVTQRAAPACAPSASEGCCA